MGLQEELDALYRRIGEIRRQMTAAGEPVFGRAFGPEEVSFAARMFERVGFGPTRVARYERAMTEVAQFGPLGFLQRDAERIKAAITTVLPATSLPAERAQTLVDRANKLAEGIVNMPLEDARRARKALQRIAGEFGVGLRY